MKTKALTLVRVLAVFLAILIPAIALAEGHLDIKSTVVANTGDFNGLAISSDRQRVAWIERPARGQLSRRCILDGQPLGDAYETIDRPVFSPDSKHVAFIARDPDYVNIFVLDGRELERAQSYKPTIIGFTPRGQCYYAYVKGQDAVIVLDGQQYIARQSETGVGRFSFSSDGKHWAYIWVELQQGLHSMRDGKESPIVAEYGLTHGGHVAVIEHDNGASRVVFDDVPQKPYQNIAGSDFFLSADGTRLVYVGDSRVVIDGQETQIGTARSFTMSPDERHFATIDSEKVVIDGKYMDWKLVPTWSNEIVFSADGKHVAYRVDADQVAVDGKRVAAENFFRVENITLSSDGTRVAFLALFNDGRPPQLIADGIPVAEFSPMSRLTTNSNGMPQLQQGPRIIFSPDGTHLAALGERGPVASGKYFVYLDGAEAECTRPLDDIEPTLDNDGVLHFFAGTRRASGQGTVQRVAVQLVH